MSHGLGAARVVVVTPKTHPGVLLDLDRMVLLPENRSECSVRLGQGRGMLW
jgi:hypothetical protein